MRSYNQVLFGVLRCGVSSELVRGWGRMLWCDMGRWQGLRGGAFAKAMFFICRYLDKYRADSRRAKSSIR